MEKFDRTFQHKGLVENKGVSNSLEALLKNYRGSVELDLVLVADGVAVVHPRDISLDIVELETLKLADLEKLQLKAASTTDDRKAAIPFLEESVGLAADTDTRLALELKASSNERAVELARKTLEKLHQIQVEGAFRHNPSYLKSQLVFQSFSIAALKEIQDQLVVFKDIHGHTTVYWPSDKKWAVANPLFDQSLIVDFEAQGLGWNEIGLRVAKEQGITEIEFQHFVLTPELIERAHNLGLKIGSSEAPSKERVQELLKWGVDYIVT